jgi:hypothetical protein
MRNTISRVVVAASVILAVACGKRGDPKPPVPVIPQATSDLVVTQRADKVILSWSYPALTTAGRSLPGVRRVVVYRYVELLPGETTGPGADPLPNSGADPGQPEAVARFAKVPALSPTQFAKLREQVDSIEGAKLPAATSGAKLLFEDAPPLHSSDGRPVRVTYGVVTEGELARSELSNLAVIVPLEIAPVPADFKAQATRDGVELTWTAAKRSATSPVAQGYDIYRSAPGELPDEFARPINAAPIESGSYTDKPAYGAYDYRITTVAATGPPRLESGLSAAANVTFKDLVPPPAPASLTALLETKVVRMIWDPVVADDLQGYLIYRTQGPYKLKLTPGPAKQTFFGDESIELGIAYVYSVTAVDKSGNESEPTKSVTVVVPKTP